MPLKLDFKSGDKMVINGTVIENIGSNAKLLVHNEASILREQDILTEPEQLTPASRVYYALQGAYLVPNNAEEHLQECRNLIHDYVTAAPSASPITDDILEQIDNGNQYKSLKAARKLIDHETETLALFEEKMKEINESDLDELELPAPAVE